MIRLLELLGEKTISTIGSFFKALIFASTIILHIFNPKSYSPANQRVLIRQIYFTAIQVLPLFSTIAILFGFGIIGVVVLLASKYGLEQSIGKIIITFTIDEAAVFFTALFISLRSSSAINTEIAVMSVRGELNTLSIYGIDAVDYLFLPRVISGVVSTLFLSTLFAIIMLFGGFVFSFIYMDLNPHSYKLLLIDAVELRDIFTLIIKSMAFGFAATTIPIYNALKATKSYSTIPIVVLNGMVKLFIAIFIIEVLSLILQSL